MAVIALRRFEPCLERHPTDDKPCERETGHDADCWYTVYGWHTTRVNGLGVVEREWLPEYPVFWRKAVTA